MKKLMSVMVSPWVISPAVLMEIRNIYQHHLNNQKVNILEVEAWLGHKLDHQQAEFDVVDGVAVVYVHGPIAKRMNMFTQISGGVSSEILAYQIHEVLADDVVKAIILDIDSPCGTGSDIPRFGPSTAAASGDMSGVCKKTTHSAASCKGGKLSAVFMALEVQAWSDSGQGRTSWCLACPAG